ncbi:MAG: hypothetical protein NTV81_02810 [Candidatus Komeilibacteria bacterium]|nr:hypothetical protein [Candidatus Komeilibacteria bacterium]
MAFYPSSDDLTNEQLKAASWWLSHKQRVWLIVFIVLLAISAGVWGWLIFKVVDFFTITQNDLALKQAKIIQQARALIQRPSELTVDNPVAIYNSNNTLDLAVQVTNPNQNWEVKALKFQFAVGEQTVPGQTVYLAPGQTTALVILHVPWNQALPEQVGITLDPSWRKVTELPAGITVSNVEIQQVDQSAQASWMVKNETLRHYWLVPFTLAAYSQGQLVAVNRVSIEKLKINEERTVAASWYGQLPKFDKVEVFSQVDPYDSANWWSGN